MLLAAWAALRTGELTANLIDTLVQAIERIDATAQRRVEEELLANLRRVIGKPGLLFRVAKASVERSVGQIATRSTSTNDPTIARSGDVAQVRLLGVCAGLAARRLRPATCAPLEADRGGTTCRAPCSVARS
jgi:hypothetical protein